MPQIPRLFKVLIVTVTKISHSPGWFVMALRYLWHGARFIVDDAMAKPRRGAISLSFYPRRPLPIYTIWGVCHALGVTMYRGTTGVVMFFADTTHFTKPLPPGSQRWINGRCRDIRKSTVARAYTDIFGRDLMVNPATYHGAVVEKSEENGVHDGRIVQCPITRPVPGKVYQRVIDNVVEPGVIEDLRATVVGDEMPLVYQKRRSIKRRFVNTNLDVRVVGADEVFSPAERARILEYARHIGLDFGEIDILRDRTDGAIYIVDANNTSIYPPIKLAYVARKACITRIAAAFERTFLISAHESRPTHVFDVIAGRGDAVGELKPAFVKTTATDVERGRAARLAMKILPDRRTWL